MDLISLILKTNEQRGAENGDTQIRKWWLAPRLHGFVEDNRYSCCVWLRPNVNDIDPVAARIRGKPRILCEGYALDNRLEARCVFLKGEETEKLIWPRYRYLQETLYWTVVNCPQFYRRYRFVYPQSLALQTQWLALPRLHSCPIEIRRRINGTVACSRTHRFVREMSRRKEWYICTGNGNV